MTYQTLKSGDISRSKRSLAENSGNRTFDFLDGVLDSLVGLNRNGVLSFTELNFTDINYDSLTPYLKETLDNYERNMFKERDIQYDFTYYESYIMTYVHPCIGGSIRRSSFRNRTGG